MRYLPDAPVFTRLAVNDAYCHILGVRRRDIMDQSVLLTSAPRVRPKIAAKLAEVIRLRSALLSVEHNRGADGRRIRVRWLDVPVQCCSGSGEVVEMIGIGQVLEEKP